MLIFTSPTKSVMMFSSANRVLLSRSDSAGHVMEELQPDQPPPAKVAGEIPLFWFEGRPDVECRRRVNGRPDRAAGRGF